MICENAAQEGGEGRRNAIDASWSVVSVVASRKMREKCLRPAQTSFLQLPRAPKGPKGLGVTRDGRAFLFRLAAAVTPTVPIAR